MSTIVAGRFETFPEAEKAAENLYGQGFNKQDVSIFYVNAAGQHHALPIGGDEHADPGTRLAKFSSMAWAAGGAVAGLLIGWAIVALFDAWAIIVIIAAGIGAYVGSLMGAMSGTRDSERPHRAGEETGVRHAGVMVAVRVDNGGEASAAGLLRDAGGADVEHSEGEWRDGKWVNFDPVHSPVLSDKGAGSEVMTGRNGK